MFSNLECLEFILFLEISSFFLFISYFLLLSFLVSFTLVSTLQFSFALFLILFFFLSLSFSLSLSLSLLLLPITVIIQQVSPPPPHISYPHSDFQVLPVYYAPFYSSLYPCINLLTTYPPHIHNQVLPHLTCFQENVLWQSYHSPFLKTYQKLYESTLLNISMIFFYQS